MSGGRGKGRRGKGEQAMRGAKDEGPMIRRRLAHLVCNGEKGHSVRRVEDEGSLLTWGWDQQGGGDGGDR